MFDRHLLNCLVFVTRCCICCWERISLFKVVRCIFSSSTWPLTQRLSFALLRNDVAFSVHRPLVLNRYQHAFDLCTVEVSHECVGLLRSTSSIVSVFTAEADE